jgi:hypothetical protein
VPAEDADRPASAHVAEIALFAAASSPAHAAIIPWYRDDSVAAHLANDRAITAAGANGGKHLDAMPDTVARAFLPLTWYVCELSQKTTLASRG